MASFPRDYSTKDGDKLDQAFFNLRFRDVHARLSSLEAARVNWEEEIAGLQDEALARVNAVIDPALQALANVSDAGLRFNTTSSTSVLVALGARSFTIAEADKGLFVPSSWLSVVSAGDPSKQMVGSLVSYNAETGELVINATNIAGTGTAVDWNISVSPPPSVTETQIKQISFARIFYGMMR